MLRDAARTKLEKALEVMGDAVGAVVVALKAELDKAMQAAKVPPLSIQIAATQDFIKRSEKRLLDLEQERKAEVALLEDAKERLAQMEFARSASAPSVSANVGPRDGSFESSKRSWATVDASERAEGSRRLDAGSQFGSPGAFCRQWCPCVSVDFDVVSRGYSNVDVDRDWPMQLT